MAELTFRSRRILYATITEYIATGEPVGSRRLAKRYGINLSPATIRNVLADLEEAGYLQQPHTSAGRVPTDAGFRLFIDALVQMKEVSDEDRRRVLERLSHVHGEEVLTEAGALLSALTGAAAVVTEPRTEEQRLVQLRFMPLREGQLLAVLVSAAGTVQNRVVSHGVALEPAELDRVNNLVSELLEGDGLSLIALRSELERRVQDDRGTVERLREVARSIVQAVVGEGTTPQLLIAGQGLLFDRPEFLDAEKIRRYLRAFDDQERLLSLLERTLASGGVQVLIGEEADFPEVRDVSLVSSSYEADDAAGSVGVIGPTRMDYAKVVPLVAFTAKVVGEALRGDEPPDGGSEDSETSGKAS